MPLKDGPPDGRATSGSALDRVRDPGNLGTVIRTVDAVGAKGVILIGETTDPFSAGDGARHHGLDLRRAGRARARRRVPRLAQRLFGGLVVGTHLKGAVDYRSVDYAGRPVLLLMGNEQQGLPDAAGRGLRPAAAHPAGRPRRFAQPCGRHRRHAVRDPARARSALAGGA